RAGCTPPDGRDAAGTPARAYTRAVRRPVAGERGRLAAAGARRRLPGAAPWLDRQGHLGLVREAHGRHPEPALDRGVARVDERRQPDRDEDLHRVARGDDVEDLIEAEHARPGD